MDAKERDARERPDGDVTGLLQAWRGGDIDARDRLATVVYQELRRRAAAHLRRERVGHTLQPTALVHEVFLLLVKRVTLDEEMAQGPAEVDVLDLDRALSALAAFDARKSQVTELRFFGGLSLEETGHVLGVSVATVEREWQAARAWLYARLTGVTA